MILMVKNGQFTKVFVKRYEDSVFLLCMSQDFFVTGVLRPIVDATNFMSTGDEVFSHAPPNTTVKEDPHDPVSRISVSRRS